MKRDWAGNAHQSGKLVGKGATTPSTDHIQTKKRRKEKKRADSENVRKVAPLLARHPGCVCQLVKLLDCPTPPHCPSKYYQ